MLIGLLVRRGALFCALAFNSTVAVGVLVAQTIWFRQHGVPVGRSLRDNIGSILFLFFLAIFMSGMALLGAVMRKSPPANEP